MAEENSKKDKYGLISVILSIIVVVCCVANSVLSLRMEREYKAWKNSVEEEIVVDTVNALEAESTDTVWFNTENGEQPTATEGDSVE